MGHPERSYLAEFTVHKAEGRRRGSGYVVAPGWVLTAAEMIAGALSVEIDLPVAAATSVSIPIEKIVVSDRAGLALVPLDKHALPSVSAIPLGKVERQENVIVDVVAVGFLQNRTGPNGRSAPIHDVHYAMGELRTSVHAAAGGPPLEMSIEAPGLFPDEMCGAPVIASGQLLGVVAGTPTAGTGTTLGVHSIQDLFGSSAEGVSARWSAALPQLGASAAELPIIQAPVRRELAVEWANGIAERLSPRILVARDEEVRLLSSLISSEKHWLWLQGTAFAGKTALLAWYATHPADDVDVVACFLRRTDGDADATYALHVLNRQLAALMQHEYIAPPYPSQRRDDFLGLLKECAQFCGDRDRRLMVLIDGLDEDQTIEPNLAVTSWLPDRRTLPPNAWMVTSSRAGVDIRIPPDHPLRENMVTINRSDAAMEIEHLAGTELDMARRVGGFLYDLLGFLAVVRGGLTVREIAELLQHRSIGPGPSDLEIYDFLRYKVPRMVIATPDQEGFDDHRFVFVHDAFRNIVRDQLQDRTTVYQAAVDEWATNYERKSWPPDTPGYLLTTYGRSVADNGNAGRLLALATDPRRHDRLRDFGADYVILWEIEAAQRLLVSQPELDLTALGKLAVYHHDANRASESIPGELPAALAKVGKYRRAIALARSLRDASKSTDALTRVVRVAVGQGHWPWGRSVIGNLPSSFARVRVLCEAAAELGAQGQAAQAAEALDWSERLAQRLVDEREKRDGLVAIAKAMIELGLPDDVRRLCRTTPYSEWGSNGLIDLAVAHAERGLSAQAASFAKVAKDLLLGIGDSKARCWSLINLSRALVKIGAPHDAAEVARTARRSAETITDPSGRDWATMAVAAELASAGSIQEAIEIAAGHADPENSAKSIAVVVDGAALVDLDEAERIALSIETQEARAEALSVVVRHLLQVGELSRAEALLDAINVPRIRAEAQLAVAYAYAGIGSVRVRDLVGKAEISMRETSGFHRTDLLARLPSILLIAGEGSRAESVAFELPSHQRARIFAQMASLLADDGRHDEAMRAAEASARTARIHETESSVEKLTRVARSFAEAGLETEAAYIAGLAGRVAHGIDADSSRDSSLLLVASAYRQARAPDKAEQFIRAASPGPGVDEALLHLVQLWADDGELRRAEALARDIRTEFSRLKAMTAVAVASARLGESRHAQSIACEMVHPYHRDFVLRYVAAALAESGKGRKAERLARRLTSPNMCTEACIAVADTLHSRRYSRYRARRLLLRARQRIAAPLDGGFFSVERLATIAEIYAKMGMTRESEATFCEALGILQERNTSFERAHLIRALVNGGRSTAAEAVVVDAMNGGESVGEAAKVLVDSLVEHSQLEAAQSFATGLPILSDRVAPLVSVAKALIDQGDCDGAGQVLGHAEEAARDIADEFHREVLLQSVGCEFAHAHLFDEAIAIANSIDHSGIFDDVVTEIAIALTDEDRVEEAEEALQAIIYEFDRAMALARIAQTLMSRSGNRVTLDPAKFLARCLVTDDDWETAIKPLIRLNPSVVVNMCHTYSELCGVEEPGKNVDSRPRLRDTGVPMAIGRRLRESESAPDQSHGRHRTILPFGG